MNKYIILLLPALLIITQLPVIAQTDTTTYRLILKQEKVNKVGKEVTGMTINGKIPGPTLRFTEGNYAVLYVKNEMDEVSSIRTTGYNVVPLPPGGSRA
ncbi:MAG: multicopper oxidase domain-containing protein [Bacteroidales bacterium]|nr:multicopper oxidase domain-containing protein [Bacteroidales bacterium]